MLKISSSGEYALLLVKYLINNPGTHTIASISEKLIIKEPFLRKITNKLEKAGIITSHKGRYGGIELMKKDTSVYDILTAVGEDLNITVCSHGNCRSSETCGIVPTIANIQRGFDTILKITRL
ncbi:MAG: Rrf2 family transcriptional regulator [Candidatus Gracilibacteria bacterium]|nr:Rrf2 family transcriptional regulator [Candidatus Gracilibacteria bacterium]